MDAHRPLKLLPNRVWRTYEGGAMLDAWSGLPEPADGPYPEDWIGSTVRASNAGREHLVEGLCRYRSGDGRFAVLKESIGSDPAAFLGERHVGKYGHWGAVLVKALDSSERLTIQVHPDRQFAKRHFGSDYGKTEAWLVLGGRTIAGEEPYLLLGFKPGMTQARWKELFEKQDIAGMTEALHRIPLREGDVFLVEGGVPHAIGSGCFLIEIQEPTDLTLRTERTTPRVRPVPDQACHQGIGFDRMLECFHYEPLEFEEAMLRWRKEPRLLNRTPEGSEYELIGEADTNCFRMRKLQIDKRYRMENADGGFSIAIVTGGSGIMAWPGGETALEKGNSFFIPAGVGFTEYTRSGEEELSIVLCYPPK